MWIFIAYIALGVYIGTIFQQAIHTGETVIFHCKSQGTFTELENRKMTKRNESLLHIAQSSRLTLFFLSMYFTSILSTFSSSMKNS
jgi:hypothetical protein